MNKIDNPQEVLKRYVAPLSNLLANHAAAQAALSTYSAQAEHYSRLASKEGEKFANIERNIEDMRKSIQEAGLSFEALENFAKQAIATFGGTEVVAVPVEEPVKTRRKRRTAAEIAADNAAAATQDADVEQGETVQAETATQAQADVQENASEAETVAPAPKRRGRPPGKKNNPTEGSDQVVEAVATEQAAAAESVVEAEKPRYPDPASQIDLEEAIAEANARQAAEAAAEHGDHQVAEADEGEMAHDEQEVTTDAPAAVSAPQPVSAPAVSEAEPVKIPDIDEADINAILDLQ